MFKPYGKESMETIQKYFRVERRNISFLKFIFEAYEGMAIIRTLDPGEGLVEFMIAPDFEQEVDSILKSLKHECDVRPVEPPEVLEEL